ncbi:unnamed protein product [Mytilus coruscus]|uniref:YqaJ viral recombinase domain-containing protein n=1 Tax=Mytilus coruscus TaxID=42192 RepID=A0A6J8DWL7_MYTCO|nr:unnamed protein product [Mytilus coruscus]
MSNQLRFIKQRSTRWFDERKEFRLTGSKLFEGLGLDSLKNLQKHHDKVVKKKDVEERIPAEIQTRMDHGTLSEIHAVATLVSKVLPIYYPNTKYIEEGAFKLTHDGKPFILVSPDESIGQFEQEIATEAPVPMLSCEFKCPFPNEYSVPVHYDIPVRYIPQILAEMASTQTDNLIYLSWTEKSSTVFRAKFDEELWGMMMTEAITLYGNESPRRPTRVSENAKEIKQKMLTYRQTCEDFLCEIPSVKCTTSGISQTNTETPYVYPLPFMRDYTHSEPDMIMVLSEAASLIKESYQICRRKATEVVVWLLSDTERIWHPEMPHSVPTAYAMKGYSLSVNIMRSMHDNILQVCSDYGLNITCSCFDGQWIKLGTRNEDDKPLTLLQLQKENITDDAQGTDETFDRLACLPDEALDALIDSGESLALITELTEGEEVNTIPVEQTEEDVLVHKDPITQGIRHQVPNTVYETILANMINHQKLSVKRKWKDKDGLGVKSAINDVQKLQKFTHDELNVVIEETIILQKKLGIVIKKSYTTKEKTNAISRLLSTGEQVDLARTVKKMLTLKEFALKILKINSKINGKTIPKQLLNTLHATLTYPVEHEKWIKSSLFSKKLTIKDVGHTEIFSYPSKSTQREKLEHICVDAHHLLVNLRVKVCKDGLRCIRKEAWHAVAQEREIIS